MSTELNEVIHAPHRLRICAFLHATDQAEFGVLRDMLGVADSVTSKHLKVLETAGYVKITKPSAQGRVRTWVQLTPAGRTAYADHVKVLQSLVAPSA